MMNIDCTGCEVNTCPFYGLGYCPEVESEERKVLVGAIEKWGPAKQTRKAVEELGELIVALSRPDSRRSIGDIEEEIVDVRIMLEQLELIFGLDTTEIRKAKIERLKGRL